MADESLAAWEYKPASEALEAERTAFVDLGLNAHNLSAMKAALERDPAWALVADQDVYLWHVTVSLISH